jgi:hypothetical protein
MCRTNILEEKQEHDSNVDFDRYLSVGEAIYHNNSEQQAAFEAPISNEPILPTIQTNASIIQNSQRLLKPDVVDDLIMLELEGLLTNSEINASDLQITFADLRNFLSSQNLSELTTDLNILNMLKVCRIDRIEHMILETNADNVKEFSLRFQSVFSTFDAFDELYAYIKCLIILNTKLTTNLDLMFVLSNIGLMKKHVSSIWKIFEIHEVVELLQDKSHMQELLDCYKNQPQLLRILKKSSATKSSRCSIM